MANLQETAEWEEGVYQLELTDPVEGGPNGVDNVQAKQLANRTAFLKQAYEDLAADVYPRADVDAIALDAKAGRRNLLINGAFDVWQRGTNVTTISGFAADRWLLTGATVANTVSRPSANTVRITKLSGETNYVALEQRIEKGTDAIDGNKVAVSFRARTSVNATAKLVFYWNDLGDSTIQEFAVTTSWQRFELVFDFTSIAATAGTFCSPQFRMEDAQFATNDWMELQEVQAEVRDSATKFEWLPYGETAHLCFRYYYLTKGTNHTIAGTAFRSGNNVAFFNYCLPTKMRTAPTLSGTWNVSIDNSATAEFTPVAYNLTNSMLSLGVPSSAGVSVDQDIVVYAANVGFDAEL